MQTKIITNHFIFFFSDILGSLRPSPITMMMTVRRKLILKPVSPSSTYNKTDHLQLNNPNNPSIPNRVVYYKNGFSTKRPNRYRPK